jgi:type I restriction-modification system DNA methylase subunit
MAFTGCLRFDDVPGKVFHDLELRNKWTAKFFSPYPLCKMMALMAVDDSDPRANIGARGLVTAMEPACGSGAMVVALADALKEGGINYQQHLHVRCLRQ